MIRTFSPGCFLWDWAVSSDSPAVSLFGWPDWRASSRGPLLGSLAGAAFARVSQNRVTTAGGGLLWGLASALLLWFASIFPLSLGKMPMMDSARAHFPALVGALLLFGAPLGLVLGAFRARARRQDADEAKRFSLARALVCGGLAGVTSGTVFAWWIARSGQLAAVAELIGSRSPLVGLTLHFVLALAIGGSFGLFFQQNVRGYGSSMGWGLSYGMLWWFLGPLTLLAFAQNRLPDWNTVRARELFDLLPAHIVYGLLLGLIYSTLDRWWIALFIESDPIRRQPEGPGSRTVRSLGRGACAGLAGGIVFIPMIAGIDGFQRIATLGGGSSFWLGMTIHLLLAVVIGMSYGWLFERESPDFISGVGWGLLYGLIWWFLGPFTLFQTLLGRPFTWSPARWRIRCRHCWVTCFTGSPPLRRSCCWSGGGNGGSVSIRASRRARSGCADRRAPRLPRSGSLPSAWVSCSLSCSARPGHFRCEGRPNLSF